MYELLMSNVMASMLWSNGLKRQTAKSTVKGNIVEWYVNKYYPRSLYVPLGVLNPLIHLISKEAGSISMSYNSKNMKKVGLVRDSKKGELLVTSPQLMVEKKIVLDLKPKYLYSDLIDFMIRDGSIKSIIRYYDGDLQKLLK